MAIIQGNAKQGSTRGFYPKVINGSLRFNDDDSAYLSWTPASAGNRKTWTFSCWVKRGNLNSSTTYQQVFSAGTANTTRDVFFFDTDVDDTLAFYSIGGLYGGTLAFRTNAVFRDPSAWYHIVLVLDTPNSTPTERFRLYVNGVRQTFSTYVAPTQNADSLLNSNINHAIGRDEGNNNQYLDGYLANVHFIDGQALTASDFGETKNGVWVAKDYAGTYGTNGFYLTFEDDTEVEAFNTVLWTGDGVGTYNPKTGVGFSPDLVWIKNRDGANHHLLFDTVRGAGSRSELSSNNTTAEGGLSLQGYDWLSSFDSDGFTTTWSGSNVPYYTDQSGYKYVAWCWDAGANNAVTGHSSVTYTGNSGTQRISGFPFSPDLIWIKARNTASFYHHISDSVRGFDKYLFPNVTLAEETNTTRVTSTTDDGMILGNKNDTNTAYNYVAWAWDAGDGAPVSNTAGSITSTVKASQANGFSIVSYTGTLANATVGHGLSSAPTFMIIRDRDNVNDWAVWHTDIGTDKLLKLNSTGASLTNTGFWNNTAPTSSVIHLGTTNLTNNSGNNIGYIWHDVTGKQKFGTYSGTGASGNTVTTGFRPGWLMVKRTDTAEEWVVYDSSRSPFNPNQLTLNPNRSDAEGSYSHLQVQFDSNGFTLLSTDSWLNASGGTYIYAAFAGSYSDYITDYNTDGSIDSRVKASDTTGFSICSYVGNGSTSTVGHGLSTTPSMIIAKTRDTATNWVVYHTSLGGDKVLQLQNTTVAQTVSGYWGTPNSSTFGVLGGGYDNNINGDNYIAYCWSETTGYSKFGSYTGNGSTDGPEVTCGFKPAFVIVKRTDSASGNGWYMWDGTRTTTNPIHNTLIANISGAEDSTSEDVNFLADGFKLLRTYGDFNASGGTYIYAAFADTREAAFWLDQSGNDNDWQPVNLDHNDTVADSPTNNFATWNPLFRGGEKSSSIAATSTLSDGNLKVSVPTNSYMGATMRPTSGQYYCEATIDTVTNEIGWGWIQATEYSATTAHAGQANKWGAEYSGYAPADIFLRDETTAIAQPTITLSNGDVIQWAWDIDAGKGWIGVNNNWYDSSGGTTGNPSTGANPTFTFTADEAENLQVYVANGTGTAVFTANFGQQPFKYDPPA